MEDLQPLIQGNEKAFKEVFYVYSQKLYNYIYLKTKSDFYANEIVQLSFIKLWKRHTLINPNIDLSVQIFQIAKSTMIDVLRKNSREQKKVEILKVNRKLFHADAINIDVIEENEVEKEYLQVVKSLPPVRQKIYLMCREENLSHKEVSEELSISIKTVKKHMQLALRQIKPMMQKIRMLFI